MVKYGVENHGFPNGKKFYSCPIENTFPKIKSMAFLMRKSFYCRPIENTFQNCLACVSVLKSFFYARAVKRVFSMQGQLRP